MQCTRSESTADFAIKLSRAMIHQLAEITVCITALPPGDCRRTAQLKFGLGVIYYPLISYIIIIFE